MVGVIINVMELRLNLKKGVWNKGGEAEKIK